MTMHVTDRTMSLAARVAALKTRHRDLDLGIAAEQRRPLPDTIVLQSLKREKLAIKDEIMAHDGVLRTVARNLRRPN